MGALAAIGILLLGALAFARYPSRRVASSSVNSEAEHHDQAVSASVPLAVQPAPPARAVAAPSRINAAPITSTTPKKAPSVRPVKHAEPQMSAPKPVVTPIAAVSTTPQLIPAASAPASVATVAAAQPPVTITGCLEMSVDQDQFRLTETEGADAPKARSWRSAFLKKRPTPVTLVEPPESVPLQTHVGQRVEATGALSSRELRVRSLKVVAPSCD
jgi:hypothetical protein